MVTFNPPSVDGSYEVELGRQFSLSCMFNRNIYPTPIQFEVSRASDGMCNSISLSIFILFMERLQCSILHSVTINTDMN